MKRSSTPADWKPNNYEPTIDATDMIRKRTLGLPPGAKEIYEPGSVYAVPGCYRARKMRPCP